MSTFGTLIGSWVQSQGSTSSLCILIFGTQIPGPGTYARDQDCGLAPIFLLNQDFDHFFILIYREVALNMERKDSKKVKKKEIPRVLNKDSKGLNRRNSTSVSSIKRKESGPKSKLFEETEGSFDTDPIESPMEEGMNQSVPGTSVSNRLISFKPLSN